MADLQEKVYQYASAVAKAKELALKLAFDDYYGRGWDEKDITFANLVAEVDISSGAEVFIINGKKMVKFSRLNQRIDVDGQDVKVFYQQDIEVLYS